MPIAVNLDVMMARRHKGAGELAEEIGITPANLSILKNNKAKAVRFSTLEALCKALDCPELGADPGLATMAQRRERRDEIEPRIAAITRGRSTSRPSWTT